MNGRVLIDTNILVYAYDRSEPQKQQQAFSLLKQLAVSNTGVLSTQILAANFPAVRRRETTAAPSFLWSLRPEKSYPRLFLSPMLTNGYKIIFKLSPLLR